MTGKEDSKEEKKKKEIIVREIFKPKFKEIKKETKEEDLEEEIEEGSGDSESFSEFSASSPTSARIETSETAAEPLEAGLENVPSVRQAESRRTEEAIGVNKVPYTVYNLPDYGEYNDTRKMEGRVNAPTFTEIPNSRNDLIDLKRTQVPQERWDIQEETPEREERKYGESGKIKEREKRKLPFEREEKKESILK